MSYVSDNLMRNEKVLFSARVHPAVFVPAAVTAALSFLFLLAGLLGNSGGDGGRVLIVFQLCIFGVFLLCAILLALQALAAMLTTEFAVTNQRVIAKAGLIRRRTLEMLLQKVESIAVSQNLAGRIFDFGTVTVVGTGGTRGGFSMIAEPMAVRRRINQVVEEAMQGVPETERVAPHEA